MTARLQVTNLSFGYGTPLTSPITFAVNAGEILAILGPSGSGKSTLLATIAGIHQPLGGVITVDGVDVTTAPIHERGVGLVFQDPLLFAHLNVGANVQYGLRRHGASKGEAQRKAAELLDWVGLAGFDERSTHKLSGGQAQRVALARAMAPEPAVLLLDEPFSALDSELRERLAHDVTTLAKRTNTAVLHVTHDAAEAARMSDASLVLEN